MAGYSLLSYSRIYFLYCVFLKHVELTISWHLTLITSIIEKTLMLAGNSGKKFKVIDSGEGYVVEKNGYRCCVTFFWG